MMTVETPTTDVFAEARELAPGTERAVLPASVDPQLFVARESTAAPGFRVPAKDVVLAQMSGYGELELRHSNVLRYPLEPGDLVYLPGGTAYRYLPATESVQLRYAAREPGVEAVAWFCPTCRAELGRRPIDPGDARAGVLAASAEFYAEQRTCGNCAAIIPATSR